MKRFSDVVSFGVWREFGGSLEEKIGVCGDVLTRLGFGVGGCR